MPSTNAYALAGAAALLMAVSIGALPISSIGDKKAAGPVPPAPPSTSCMMLNQTSCFENTCCNWCSPPPSPFVPGNITMGFCMPLIPFGPIPTLQCDKAPVDCKSVISNNNCVLFPECQWVPFGPPGSAAGMCVYNWTRCSTGEELLNVPTPAEEVALARLAMKKAAEEEAKVAAAEKEAQMAAVDPTPAPPAPTPKPPKPSMCNMTTAEPCDACECCQWCSTPFNLTGGFCMSMGPFPPPPALNCSKGVVTCKAYKLADACMAQPLCAWLPISPTKGMCLFNWDKCKLPPAEKNMYY